jgi:DNA polymerase-1
LFQELIMPLSAAVANVEKAGICFDSERLSQISALVKEKISALEHDLERQIGKRINYFSHKQLSEFLYEGLRIRSEARTASGKLSTDKKALESFASRHPAIKTILRLRALKKLLNTYLDGPAGRSGLRSWVKSDGKIYPNYLLHGTVTGRLSCKEPNLQNIPRIASIRQLFVAEAGYKLLEADYDQAELRVAAALSNDPLFLEDLRDDIHRRVASIIFGKSYEAVSDSERSKAKGVTFGILYGSSARGLSELIAISEEEARTFINSFLDRYQVLARWFQRLVFEAKRKGYVRNRFGRIRYFTFRDADENQRAEFFRQVINFPIQSTLADIVSRATILLDSALQGLNGRTVALMHDAFLIEVPEANVLQYSELVEALMKEACPKDLPLPVKIKIGNRWWDGVSDDFLELEVQSTP